LSPLSLLSLIYPLSSFPALFWRSTRTRT
jgi:hypothetical protein